MDDEQTLGKAQRLLKIQHLLYCHPQGMTSSQLAEACGVCQRTIERDIAALHDLKVNLWEKGRRYGIAAGYFLPPLNLTLPEATSLLLAARLLATYSDERNPHTIQALSKLAAILPQPIAEPVYRTVQVIRHKAENAAFNQVLETLAIAWATRRRVKILYQSARSQNVHEQVVSPYFLQPSAAGYATYLIGYADFFDAVRTFKVERILAAELLEDTYDLPPDFDLDRCLSSAWGIIWGEETEVKLRFAPSAVRRLKECVWHPSQVLEEQADGGCLLTLRVASTLEITPWVLGWGDQVEVLEPKDFRESIRETAQRMAAQYRDCP
ncbi:MAG: WYL domain-containing protein [Chloroflexi bacterium]|nr:WYL domain-containing protein [Chloroflexota bacterium]MCL5076170.1 WYL domain-containing protein [Chloroflexota bacterium]